MDTDGGDFDGGHNGHDHYGHDHGHHHHHHHAADAAPDAAATSAANNAAKTSGVIGRAWQNIVSDTRSRLMDGINPHAKMVAHGDHFHAANPQVTTVGKVGIAAGATVSMGVALHGVLNMQRGLMGWEDKDMGEKHGPSAQYLLVGAAETIGGLALCKRILTGTFKLV